MSQKAFISDADATLANLIWNAIKNASAAKNIILSEEQISFSSPKGPSTRGTRKLSIFLYGITGEQVAKMLPTVDCSDKDTVPFVLHYLVTPFTGNDRNDHVLLEEIVHAIFAGSPIDSANEVEGKNVGLTVKIDQLSLGELSKLWIALGVPLRISLSLAVSLAGSGIDIQEQVTAASVTPQAAALETRPVIELYQPVLKTFTEQSNGWKSRNVFFKQMMFQNFKKMSDVTVDEMLAALNSLGDKLEQHGSTAQFVKPLNALAGYYKHQLGELEGLQKLSHKQTENIEMVTTWIKDVEALLEALPAKS
jgi:hypothetical protein